MPKGCIRVAIVVDEDVKQNFSDFVNSLADDVDIDSPEIAERIIEYFCEIAPGKPLLSVMTGIVTEKGEPDELPE